MTQQEHPAALIETRLWAILALGYAGLLAAWRIWFLLASGDPQVHWILTFDEILPPITRLTLHVLVYGLVLAGLIQVVRELRGADRVYCVTFLGDLLLYPLRNVLPMPGAAWILWLQTSGNVVMFVAAGRILLAIGGAAKKAGA